MNKTTIGQTNVTINPVGFGTNAVGGHNIFPHVSDDTGRDMVKAAIEKGMTFLDTAFYYGLGRSEELIGEVWKDVAKRDELVFATKAAHIVEDGETRVSNDPAFLTQAVDDALKRLQTDHIELFYIHFPDEDTPKSEAVGALQRLKEQGKISAIGVSNFTMDQIREANADGYLDVIQGEYNLLKRHAEQELLPYVRNNGMSFIPYFPLASGLLTGKYTKDTELSERQQQNPLFEAGNYERTLQRIEQLREMADRKGVDVSNIVLAWYLTRDGIDAIIPGAKQTAQVEKNAQTMNVDLNEDEQHFIDTLFTA